MLYLALPLTILLYWLTRKLYQRIPLPFINPLLIPMVVLMLILHFGQLPLQDFMDGTWIINWLLKPAVVALALPLYQQMIHIKAKIKPIMICCSISVVISILTSMLICRTMGIDEEITRSIATRSITTPLAMSVSESLGGDPIHRCRSGDYGGNFRRCNWFPATETIRCNRPSGTRVGNWGMFSCDWHGSGH